MAKRKGKPYKIGMKFTNRYGDAIEISSCFEGWWGGPPGYHVILNGKRMIDACNTAKYVTDEELEKLVNT